MDELQNKASFITTSCSLGRRQGSVCWGHPLPAAQKTAAGTCTEPCHPMSRPRHWEVGTLATEKGRKKCVDLCDGSCLSHPLLLSLVTAPVSPSSSPQCLAAQMSAFLTLPPPECCHLVFLLPRDLGQVPTPHSRFCSSLGCPLILSDRFITYANKCR